MIDPTFMSAVEWTDRMALLLPGQQIRIDRDQDWKPWVRHLLQSPEISQYNPPQPDAFSDWREWAYRFNQVVPLT